MDVIADWRRSAPPVLSYQRPECLVDRGVVGGERIERYRDVVFGCVLETRIARVGLDGLCDVRFREITKARIRGEGRQQVVG